MVSAARRLGEVPTLAEWRATLERVVAEQAEVIAALTARIAALEDRLGVQDDEAAPHRSRCRQAGSLSRRRRRWSAIASQGCEWRSGGTVTVRNGGCSAPVGC
jgi:hypothetical protein